MKKVKSKKYKSVCCNLFFNFKVFVMVFAKKTTNKANTHIRSPEVYKLEKWLNYKFSIPNHIYDFIFLLNFFKMLTPEELLKLLILFQVLSLFFQICLLQDLDIIDTFFEVLDKSQNIVWFIAIVKKSKEEDKINE